MAKQSAPLAALKGSAEPQQPLSLKLPPEVLEQLTEAAAAINCKRSALARALLIDGLERHGMNG